jgi:H+/Cl- antiporter ClcA
LSQTCFENARRSKEGITGSVGALVTHGLVCLFNLTEIVFLLLFSAALKLCFMTLTFGIRVPAGVFVPSLVVGGMVGRAFGICMQLLQESYPKVRGLLLYSLLYSLRVLYLIVV